MNPYFTYGGAVALLLTIIAAVLFAPAIARTVQRAGLVAAFNVFTEGTHELSIPRRSAGVIVQDWLLVKETSPGIVDLCGAADMPQGLCDDQAAAAGDRVNVILLGISNRTLLARAAENVAAKVDIYTSATLGCVQDEPAVAGTYWKVGRTVRAASSGDLVEFEPCTPTKLVVLTALTTLDAECSGAVDLAALKTATEKIADDLRRIAGASSTATLVKILAA